MRSGRMKWCLCVGTGPCGVLVGWRVIECLMYSICEGVCPLHVVGVVNTLYTLWC